MGLDPMTLSRLCAKTNKEIAAWSLFSANGYKSLKI